MITKGKVEKLVEAQNEGLVFELYGPYKIMEVHLWEVWVKHGTEFFTRFVIDEENRPPIYVNDFSSLIPAISQRIAELGKQNEMLMNNLAAKHEREVLNINAAHAETIRGKEEESERTIRSMEEDQRRRDSKHTELLAGARLECDNFRRSLEASAAKTHQENLKLYVAAAAFVAAVIALLVLVLRGPRSDFISVIFGGLVASGGLLFFGRWLGQETILSLLKKWHGGTDGPAATPSGRQQ